MSRLPALGPRGEGWVAIQFALLWAIVATGLLGPAWEGTVRLVTGVIGIVLIAGGIALAARAKYLSRWIRWGIAPLSALSQVQAPE